MTFIQFVRSDVSALASFPTTTISHHPAMESIPQELIDAIIDNVPRFSLPSCSLVAKRWRRKSQRRVLSAISFSSEDEVDRWCTDIPRDSDGISSYVRRVKVELIHCWAKPTLFSCMLETLSSLTELSLVETEIPGEFLDRISRGGLGRGVAILSFWSSCFEVAAVTSMILSLPDLKELSVYCLGIALGGPLRARSVAPRRQLHSLVLRGNANEIGEALARHRITSTHLSLDVHTTTVEQLLMLSSETVVKLELSGMCFLQTLRPNRDDGD
jgi:hypothetical protein